MKKLFGKRRKSGFKKQSFTSILLSYINWATKSKKYKHTKRKPRREKK